MNMCLCVLRYALGVPALCEDSLVDQEAVLVRWVMGLEGREKDPLEPLLRGGLVWEWRVAGLRAPLQRGGLVWEWRVAGLRAPLFVGMEGGTAERGFGVGMEGGRPEGTTAERGFGVGMEGGRPEGTTAERGFGEREISSQKHSHTYIPGVVEAGTTSASSLFHLISRCVCSM